MKKVIIGRKPVLEAINSGEKLDSVQILYGQSGSIITSIQVAAKKRNIKCGFVTLDKFKYLSKDENSQGVIAIKYDFKFYSLEEIIKSIPTNEIPLLLILDSIQDPHNLGAILRTAECAGVHGVFITKHNSAPLNETAIKVAAGAVSLLKISMVNNVAQTIQELKKLGIWIAGSTLEKSKNIYDFDSKLPLAVIVGNEEKGIRKLTADNCDFLIKIPMTGKLQSLNVSVATGIILFEIQRKRLFQA